MLFHKVKLISLWVFHLIVCINSNAILSMQFCKSNSVFLGAYLVSETIGERGLKERGLTREEVFFTKSSDKEKMILLLPYILRSQHTILQVKNTNSEPYQH